MQDYKAIFCKSRWIDKYYTYYPCELCWEKGEEIHHILSSHRGARNVTSWDTLISVCVNCHDKVEQHNDYDMRVALLNIVQAHLSLIRWWNPRSEIEKLEMQLKQ